MNEEGKKGIFIKLKTTLSKTKAILTEKLKEISLRRFKISENVYEEIYDILIKADVGAKTSEFIINRLKENILKKGLSDTELIYLLLKDIIKEIIDLKSEEISINNGNLKVVIFVGVNGSGKTTTVAKYGNILLKGNKSILLAGCDTYRAAAGEQLEVWANRLKTDIIMYKNYSDPSAVLYDAISSAQAKEMNYILTDTAGRLHTNRNLIEELKKMKRTAQKRVGEQNVFTILVIDAINGQNVLSQTKIFNDALSLSSIIITKLDGTAKGGVIIPVCNEFKIPIDYIGTGESLDDLKKFSAKEFIDALFE